MGSINTKSVNTDFCVITKTARKMCGAASLDDSVDWPAGARVSSSRVQASQVYFADMA